MLVVLLFKERNRLSLSFSIKMWIFYWEEQIFASVKLQTEKQVHFINYSVKKQKDINMISNVFIKSMNILLKSFNIS